METNQQVRVGDIVISNNQPLKLIAGPCQLESRSHALEMSTALYEISKNLGIEIIYKTSFDKANRTSSDSRRGLGLKDCIPIFFQFL